MSIDAIIERRRTQQQWDPELWDFAERVMFASRNQLNDPGVVPGPLQHVRNEALQARLDTIDHNIQYLDVPGGPRDDWPPEKGWLSPWWWLRLRHWTLSEFARRGIAAGQTPVVAPAVPVHPDLLGVHSDRAPRLFQISRVPFLMRSLEEGQLRFAPAVGYKAMEDDEARSDDELTKGYRRASGRVTITTLDGKPIKALGDVRFDTTRVTAEGVALPYWMLCASTDLDPRLFDAFPSGEGDDGVLAIFDPAEFKRRASVALAKALPDVRGRIAVIDYYDVFHPSGLYISPVTMKAMRFAYQRELRFVLDPGRGAVIADGAFFMNIGSMADIAGVYDSDGRRIAGMGPDTYLR
ncbi:hypothetical protein FHS96_005624 [Sphingomonas zeicaulis]|uniref:hypothetical protein n=1 Tax=Sphingomonas zeicaulis TaxID=1632740 RepID=UPI003D22BB76